MNDQIFFHIYSAKILLLPPKYEKIMVPFIFQHCDSNIGLFSIAPYKVITLNPLCILFIQKLKQKDKEQHFLLSKVGRAITKWRAIEKSPILLS